MAYGISLKLSNPIEVLHSDVSIVVRQDGEKIGTLTLSKGTIDWRPKHAKSGKEKETQLTWAQFAEVMKKANDR